MDIAPPPLVHEAETQRQHVRVRLPGTIALEAGDGRLRLQLTDLSAGGIGFRSPTPLRAGQHCSGRIQLDVESLALSIPVKFQVRHYDAASGRGGGSFENLAPAEIATIRRVVTAALSGELVGVDDVLHTLSRNNFTAPRQNGAPPAPRSGAERLRATAVTALFVLFGAMAFLYIGHQVDERLFGARSSAARVGGPSFSVTMPRDGIFRSLVPADGVVKKGAPLGSFETSMLDLVRGQAMEAKLDPATLDALLQRSVKGTITSPCDCRVETLLSADGQYVGKGQALAALVPLHFEPHVVARFRYPQAERIEPGTPVTVNISGEGERYGRVVQLRHGSDDGLADHIVAVVQPDQPIDMKLLSRRAEVSLRGGSFVAQLGGLLGTANAGDTDAAP